jgi:hypothetical protein
MSLIVQVKILDAGTGTNPVFGLLNDDLVWCSSGTTFGTPRFIDQGSVTGLSNAIAIAQGGNLGGPQGEIQITVTSLEIMQAVLTDQLKLTGKTLIVSFSTDGSALVVRYTGKVSSWAGVDEISFSVRSLASTQLDTSLIESMSVTSAIALGVDESSAEGKNITEPFGRLIDYPMIFVRQNVDYIAWATAYIGSTLDGLYEFYSAFASNPLGINQVLETNGTPKGISILPIDSAYQPAENDNVWIVLGKTDGQFFEYGTGETETYLRNALVGKTITIVRGVGEGGSFRIVAVQRDTKNSIDGIWLQLSLTDIAGLKSRNETSSFLQYAGPTGTDLIDDEYFYFPGFSNGYQNDISYVSLTNQQDVYLIHSEANTDDPTSIEIFGIGVNDAPVKIPLDYKAITIIYERDNWKMVRINFPKNISNEETEISFVNYEQKTTRVHEIAAGGPRALNYLGFGLGSAYSKNFTDMQIIPQLPAPGGLVSTKVFSVNQRDTFNTDCQYIPLEELYDGADLSKDGDLYLMPSFEFAVQRDNFVTVLSTATLIIEVYAVDEQNNMIGYKSASLDYTYDNLAFASDFILNINPAAGYIQTNTEAREFGGFSYSAFNAIKDQLGVSELIKAGSIRQIRGLIVRTRMSYQEDVAGSPVSISASARSKSVWVGYSQTLDKSTLHLRTTKNGKESSVLCPADIASDTATTMGIPIDSTSWLATSTAQKAIMFSPSTFSGQVHPELGSSISDVLAEISKGSITAAWVGRDGVLYSRWFVNDNADTSTVLTFDGTNIEKRSFSVSKNNGGYRYTDYAFEIMRNMLSASELASINSGSGLTAFPSENEFTYNVGSLDSPEWVFDLIELTSTDALYLNATNVDFPEIGGAIFVPGTIWEMTSATKSATGILRVVAPGYVSPSGTIGTQLCFELDAGSNSKFEPTSMRMFGPDPKWRDLVSGSFITDYIAAKNIWEHAQEARAVLLRELPMPKETTQLKNPIWGEDDRGLSQWMLYSVLHGSKDKTIIRFETRLESETMALELMDFVKIQHGVYSINPTYGWVVEMTDNPALGTMSVTVMTALSDADIFILDETDGTFELTVDETTGITTRTYDEGGLA